MLAIPGLLQFVGKLLENGLLGHAIVSEKPTEGFGDEVLDGTSVLPGSIGAQCDE